MLYRILLLLVSVTALAAEPSEGPGLSGGGNGLNGKPLESYAVALQSLPEYMDVVEPALAVVEKKLPDLASDLRNAVTAKSWYFVPVPLTKLKASEIGVFFSTDQLALQTAHSVWIAQQFYKWNGLREKGTLLLHELVMSLLLQDRFECLRRHSDCTLTARDYDAVRHLTNVILRQPLMTAEALRDLVAQLGFGTYTVGGSMKTPAPFGLEELYLSLQAEQDLGGLPKGCYYDLQLRNGELTLDLYSRNAQGEPNRNASGFRFATRAAPRVRVLKDAFVVEAASPDLALQGRQFRRRLTVEFQASAVSRVAGSWEQLVFNYRTGQSEWLTSPTGPAYSFEPGEVNCIR